MRNRYSTQKNNKKNRRRGNIKTRSMQRGGVAPSSNTRAYAPRQHYNNRGYRGDIIETDNSSFGIDLSGLKSALLSQLMGILSQSEEEDIPHEKKDEIVDYIKNSEYIRELRRSFHDPTELQKGMQDFIDGIEAKILEYPEKWQASRLEKKNVLDANGLLQSSINNFSTAVKEGQEMSMGKPGHSDKPGNVVPKPAEHSVGDNKKPVVPSLVEGHAPNAVPGLEKSVVSNLSSMLESKNEGQRGGKGKVNVHEHPRKYIKEIKDNRKKLYEKEMEIIRSIRTFNNGNTRARNNVQSHNKYHTRKFRRAIMK